MSTSPITKNQIKLGYKVKDIVTGFTGTVTTIGCISTDKYNCYIEPTFPSPEKSNEGKWVHSNRLQTLSSNTEIANSLTDEYDTPKFSHGDRVFNVINKHECIVHSIDYSLNSNQIWYSVFDCSSLNDEGAPAHYAIQERYLDYVV